MYDSNCQTQVYLTLLMNTHFIHDDSLLSCISNISVKIQPTQKDGAEFFTNYQHHSHQDHENDAEIKIEGLAENQEIDASSLLQKINLSTKPQANGHDQASEWVTTKQMHGVSEDQDQSFYSSKTSEAIQKLEEVPDNSILKRHRQSQAQRKSICQKSLKNETKNIPKNYGKAIITFVQKFESKVKPFLEKNQIDYRQFLKQLKEKKRTINTISDLRSLWMDFRWANEMRAISGLFLRKYALSYIFNSRIANHSSHTKYKHRLCEAIKEPFAFRHIKDY